MVEFVDYKGAMLSKVADASESIVNSVFNDINGFIDSTINEMSRMHSESAIVNDNLKKLIKNLDNIRPKKSFGKILIPTAESIHKNLETIFEPMRNLSLDTGIHHKCYELLKGLTDKYPSKTFTVAFPDLRRHTFNHL